MSGKVARHKRPARVIDLGRHHGPHDVVFPPGSSRRALVTTQTSAHVVEVDVESGQVVAPLATLRGFVRPDRISISPDGQRALITDWVCELVQVVDVPSRRPLGAIAGLEGAGVAKVFPDSRLAVIAMLAEGAIALADLDERRVIAPFELGKRIDAAAWGPAPRD